jgi:hypothetical protein
MSFHESSSIIEWSISILKQLKRADCPVKLRDKAGWLPGFAVDIDEWLEVLSMIDRTFIQANTKGVWEFQGHPADTFGRTCWWAARGLEAGPQHPSNDPPQNLCPLLKISQQVKL